MDNNRHTEIIVEEIKYWREHNLLSKEKCDFLLALYTQGEETYHESAYPKKRRQVQNIASLVTLLCLIPLSFVITYFTDFYEILQLVIFILFISFSFWAYSHFKKNEFPFQYVALLTGLMMTLYTSVFLTRIVTETTIIIECVIFVNFLIWVWIGWKNRLRYVLIIGSAALLFLLISIIL